MAEEFGRPISDIAKLNGDLVLALGISSFLSIVLANVFGKRPIYLLSALIFLGGCIWAALCELFRPFKLAVCDVADSLNPFTAKSYSGLVGARWIQGLGKSLEMFALPILTSNYPSLRRHGSFCLPFQRDRLVS